MISPNGVRVELVLQRQSEPGSPDCYADDADCRYSEPFGQKRHKNKRDFWYELESLSGHLKMVMTSLLQRPVFNDSTFRKRNGPSVEAPRANVYCERFLGSLRRECLDYMLILSERHLRQMVTNCVTYFNRARPHQGIHQRIPCAPQLPEHPVGEIVGIPVLGGLHHDYQRKAA
jgi:hypothetical protein